MRSTNGGSKMNGKIIADNVTCIKGALMEHVSNEKCAADLAFDLAELHSELDIAKTMLDEVLKTKKISHPDLLRVATIIGYHWHNHIKSLRKIFISEDML